MSSPEVSCNPITWGDVELFTIEERADDIKGIAVHLRKERLMTENEQAAVIIFVRKCIRNNHILAAYVVHRAMMRCMARRVSVHCARAYDIVEKLDRIERHFKL